MSFVSKYLHSGNIKLFVALGVPVLIAWIFIYSQKMADEEMKRHNKEVAEHPTAEHVLVKNYELKEVDDSNHMRWHLRADAGEMSDDNKTAYLKKVIVEYFDGQTVKMRLIAPTGTAEESSKYVVLNSMPRIPVVAQGEAGKFTMKADKVELMKKNLFKASGNVNIEWPKVAKVKGDLASGRVDLDDLKNFKISGNTYAQLGIQ